jgi:predicted dienelactone hydrolase
MEDPGSQDITLTPATVPHTMRTNNQRHSHNQPKRAAETSFLRLLSPPPLLPLPAPLAPLYRTGYDWIIPHIR